MQTLLISLCETANFINFTMQIGKFANFAVRNRESFANWGISQQQFILNEKDVPIVGCEEHKYMINTNTIL